MHTDHFFRLKPASTAKSCLQKRCVWLFKPITKSVIFVILTALICNFSDT